MKYYVLLIVFCLSVTGVLGQQALYEQEQGIEIDYSDEHGIHFVHTVYAGHTLYSLSRVFQVPPARIVAYNGKAPREAIRLGERLRIPFDEELLYTGVSVEDFKEGLFLPVFYTVKPQETLFRISRIYFDQDASILLQRNSLTGNSLSIGQRLLMGWIPLDRDITLADDSISQVQILQVDTVQEITATTSDERIQDGILADQAPDSMTVDLPITPEELYIERQETGLAYWNKASLDRENLFVLHATARINSLIEIYNPQLQRRTFAKVIARIPQGTYPDNIDVIVSPRVAHTLGALNSEFRVRMKYFE